jgi:hypothetical protein
MIVKMKDMYRNSKRGSRNEGKERDGVYFIATRCFFLFQIHTVVETGMKSLPKIRERKPKDIVKSWTLEETLIDDTRSS